jgi:uncharacterized protein
MKNSISSLPRLGVGITYAPEQEHLIHRNQDLLDFIEIEPQTVWLRTNKPGQQFLFPKAMMEHLQTLPGRKLIHSVGVPVGGNLPPDPEQLALLRQTVDYFDTPWASEHMGFNATHEFQTGFFLPQKQTAAGAQIAVDNIRRIQDALGVPIAIETGVNYLRPRSGEMSDGTFISTIIEQADCGLLLDLHNLYTNQLNGRQSIQSVLSELPLSRVWEVHLAGGIELDGFWLDAHSGAMPAALIEIAEKILPKLPNLRGLTFEMLSSYLERVGESVVREQLLILRALWEKAGVRPDPVAISRPLNVPNTEASPALLAHPADTIHWEAALSRLATGYTRSAADMSDMPTDDPGVKILNKLINEFRASMLVNTLRLTCRYMMLTFGVEAFTTILSDFWANYPPRQFASEEADQFIEYLKSKHIQFANLTELLDYEEAAMHTLMDGQMRVAAFSADPFPLFRALTEGRLPDLQRTVGHYELEITPDIMLA